MVFHKAISIDNSESDKVPKTFIFMSTIVILYILKLFSMIGCRGMNTSHIFPQKSHEISVL